MKKEEVLQIAKEHKEHIVSLMRNNHFELEYSNLYYDGMTNTYNLLYVWKDLHTGIISPSLYVFDEKYLGGFSLCLLEDEFEGGEDNE